MTASLFHVAILNLLTPKPWGPQRSRPARRRQAGSSLIEFGLTAAIMGPLLVYGGVQVMKSGEENRVRASAMKTADVQAAAEAYVRDNYQGLVNSLAGGKSLDLTPEDLADKLPPGFNGINTHGQANRVRITESAPGILEVVTYTEGGTAIPAIQAKVAGDRVHVGHVDAEAQAHGPSKSWQRDPAAEGWPVTSGHFITLRRYDQQQGLADYVYRTNTGNPVANTMATDLNMKSHNITGVGTLTATQVTAGDAAVTDVTAATINAATLTVSGGLSVDTTLKIGDHLIGKAELATMIALHNTTCPTGDFLTRDDAGFSCVPRTVPAGAIMTFNLPTCPDGWTLYSSGAGRVLVGTNDGANGLTAYKLGQSGGADGAYIQMQNLPAGVWVEGSSANDMAVGGDYAHANVGSATGMSQQALPTLAPYIAMTMCQKM